MTILSTRRSVLLILLLLLAMLWFAITALSGHLPQAVQAASLQSPLVCQELLTNGNLETSGGWTFTATPNPGAIVDSPTHGDTFAMRLGIAGGANAQSYSTAYQSITLPANAGQIVLTYWERPAATGDSADFRDTILFRPDFTTLRTLDHQTGAGNDQWTQRTFDVSDLAGQAVVLYFNVYNNGSGATTANYLDDISLQSCDSAAPATPTPTFTPTSTQIVTPGIVTATATVTPTATATPLSNSVRVQMGSSSVTQGQTQVQIPLDLLGARDEIPVGVVSLTLQYDASKVKATACTTSDRFDLLLCNIAKTGVVQLAGVAASGIRSDARIADLAFEILQPQDLYTPLTVQIRRLSNRDGDTLSASAQDGQIGSPCSGGGANCRNVYLPLVQR